MEDAIPGNSAIHSSGLEGDVELRKAFFEDLEKFPFDYIIKKYFPMPTLMSKIKIQLERVNRLFKLLYQVILSPNQSKKL